jgi:NMD protein affecting ribosome stability and mRNA decay
VKTCGYCGEKHGGTMLLCDKCFVRLPHAMKAEYHTLCRVARARLSPWLDKAEGYLKAVDGQTALFGDN